MVSSREEREGGHGGRCERVRSDVGGELMSLPNWWGHIYRDPRKSIMSARLAESWPVSVGEFPSTGRPPIALVFDIIPEVWDFFGDMVPKG